MTKSADTAKQWFDELVRAGNLDETTRGTLEQVFTKPEVADYVGRSALRQSDYDRMMNTQKQQFDLKTQEVVKYERELAHWRAGQEKSLQQVQQDLAQARSEAQRVRTVATTYGLTEEDLGSPQTTAPPPSQQPTQQPPFDTTAFLSRKDFEEAAAMHTLLPAEINDIVADHVKLFGQQPNNMRSIVERAVREQRPLREVYEETYEVPNKREEIARAAQDAEVKRRVEEELTKYRTEHSLPIPRPQAARSSVLAEKLTPPEDMSSMAGDHLTAVQAAVAHYNSLDRSGE